MLPLTPPETQKLAAWEPAVHFVYRIARIWTRLLAIWGVIQQTVYHHSGFSSVDEIKRAIVSMAETTAWRSHCQFITFIIFLFTVNVIRQMAPPFSKVDSNKWWHDVQHEENVICAQFGKDMFNISKVIGRKKVAQFFLTHSVYFDDHMITITQIVNNRSFA